MLQSNLHQITKKLVFPSNILSNVGKITQNLSISHKISCGYAIAISIAIVGTTTGIILGNNQMQQARKQMSSADAERSYIAKLQTEALQTRLNQQQIILVLEQPDKLEKQHNDFIRDTQELKELLDTIPPAIDPNDTDNLRLLVDKYKTILNNYLETSENIFKENNLLYLSKPEQILNARQKLIDFANSETAIQLDKLSQDLEEIADIVDNKDEEANQAIAKVDQVRNQIIFYSTLLSILIATLLAIYTSKAIAQPLQKVTQVAKQVTEDSNFTLQVPVTTQDEVGVLATSLNHLIMQVKQLLEEQQAEATKQLMQNEKMASLGQMVAGVAHELNNPLNFIYGNLAHVRDYITDLLQLLEIWEKEISNPPEAVTEYAEEIDIDFLKSDLPKMLESMKFGAERARAIILSLKDFSRLDKAVANNVNLHECIDSSLLILNNRIKKCITIKKNYGEVANIEGYAGFLYQVFVNILNNAIDALEENPNNTNKEIIITTTAIDTNWVEVSIADNGPGIAPENLEKIFAAFFTTKPRGFGTGLGLPICHQIVVEKHGGKLKVESELGKGTEFCLCFPIRSVKTN